MTSIGGCSHGIFCGMNRVDSVVTSSGGIFFPGYGIARVSGLVTCRGHIFQLGGGSHWPVK